MKRNTARRVREALVALVFLGSLGVTVGAQPVHADWGIPKPNPTNGCTLSPDYPNGWDFKTSCDRHDICYDRKPYGRSEAGRKACDDVFGRNLVRWCTANVKMPTRLKCVALAGLYHDMVRRLGVRSFYSS